MVLRSLTLVFFSAAAFVVVEALAGTPAGADSTSIPSTEARRMVAAVMEGFKPVVGRYVFRTFDEPPRQAFEVPATMPIAVVAGDSRIAPVPGVYSNCVAKSSTREIHCDLRLLDDLIDDFALTQGDGQKVTARRHILQLVLAHELGHIVHGDQSAAYHGTADGFSVFRYLHYKIELSADAFAVRLIDGYAKDSDLEYQAIVDLASGAVAKSLCPDTFPAPCPCPGYTNAGSCSRIPLGPGLLIADEDRLPVTLTGTHPEYVVRFARLLYLSHNRRTSFYRNEARQVLLRVVVRNEQGEIESADALFH